jgi:hypothetical protein
VEEEEEVTVQEPQLKRKKLLLLQAPILSSWFLSQKQLPVIAIAV